MLRFVNRLLRVSRQASTCRSNADTQTSCLCESTNGRSWASLESPFLLSGFVWSRQGLLSLGTNQCIWKSTTLTTGYVSRWNSLLSTIMVASKQSGGPRDSQQPQQPWHITRSGWARIWQNCSRMSHKQTDASWGRSKCTKAKSKLKIFWLHVTHWLHVTARCIVTSILYQRVVTIFNRYPQGLYHFRISRT